MFRKLFFYKCDNCGKERQTFNEDVLKDKLCRKCKATAVPENQRSIFDAIKNVENSGENVK